MSLYEFESIHKTMGCEGCRFCDKRALNKGPCCTYPGNLSTDAKTGKCRCREERQKKMSKWLPTLQQLEGLAMNESFPLSLDKVHRIQLLIEQYTHLTKGSYDGGSLEGEDDEPVY